MQSRKGKCSENFSARDVANHVPRGGASERSPIEGSSIIENTIFSMKNLQAPKNLHKHTNDDNDDVDSDDDDEKQRKTSRNIFMLFSLRSATRKTRAWKMEYIFFVCASAHVGKTCSCPA